MAHNEASYEAFDAVEVKLERGAVVRGRALTLADAIRFTRLHERAAAGSPSAVNQLLDEFPAAAGLEDARLNGAELLAEVLPPFLYQRGTGRPLAAEATASSSTSDSMT